MIVQTVVRNLAKLTSSDGRDYRARMPFFCVRFIANSKQYRTGARQVFSHSG